MKTITAIAIAALLLAASANAGTFLGIEFGSTSPHRQVVRQYVVQAPVVTYSYTAGGSTGYQGGSTGFQGGSSGYQGGGSTGYSGGYATYSSGYSSYGVSPVYASRARRVTYLAAPRRTVYRGYGSSPCPPGMNCP